MYTYEVYGYIVMSPYTSLTANLVITQRMWIYVGDSGHRDSNMSQTRMTV